MWERGHDSRRNRCPWHNRVGVEVAKLHTPDKQTAETAVDIGLRQVAAFNGGRDMTVLHSTLQVSTGKDGIGRGSLWVVARAVSSGQEIADSTAVADHKPAVAPLAAEYLSDKFVAATAWMVVVALVGTHHLAHIGLLHKLAESGQICLTKVPLAYIVDVECMTVPFRPAVYGKMFRAGICFAVSGRIGPLQSLHHSHTHTSREVGVFAVRLLSAAPSRITEDIYIRSPERHTAVVVEPARTLGYRVLGTALVADSGKYPFHQSVVERRGHLHSYGKYGGRAVTSYPVESLAPPVPLRDTEPRNRRRRVSHQRCFLFKSKARKQVVGTLFK